MSSSHIFLGPQVSMGIIRTSPFVLRNLQQRWETFAVCSFVKPLQAKLCVVLQKLKIATALHVFFLVFIFLFLFLTSTALQAILRHLCNSHTQVLFHTCLLSVARSRFWISDITVITLFDDNLSKSKYFVTRLNLYTQLQEHHQCTSWPLCPNPKMNTLWFSSMWLNQHLSQGQQSSSHS